MSEDLLDVLARDARARPGRRVGAKLTLALTAGAIVSLAGVLLLLGPRSDLREASASPMFWMKLAYPAAITALAFWCVERLARPAGEARRRAPWLAAPFCVMALLALSRLATAPADRWRALIMGDSAMTCPWRVLAAATPVFIALFWVLRGLAPTRLRLAGAAAGLSAGGVGATAYALYCTEPGAPFVAIWYTLGILAPCGIGALAGPRLLRW
jgi:hypothetical protein